MAEGLFNVSAPAGWRARSAGTDPHESVRGEAVAVMREVGIDIGHHRPKPLGEALLADVRLVVGLCAEEACPVIPGVRSLHWPLPNPAGGGLAVYRSIRDDLERRIRSLVGDLARAPGAGTREEDTGRAGTGETGAVESGMREAHTGEGGAGEGR